MPKLLDFRALIEYYISDIKCTTSFWTSGNKESICQVKKKCIQIQNKMYKISTQYFKKILTFNETTV